jgi:Xaa-Pro aminopeptidase
MLLDPTPFNPDVLDRLMDDAGIDVLFATSKHNVQYLLGGYRAQFFDFMDAIGVSRYLPLVLYPKGAPDKAAYFGHRFEIHQTAVERPWIPEVRTKSWGSVDVIEAAVAYMKERGVPFRKIGVEASFLPFESGVVLGDAIGPDTVVDASFVLERLRARKSKREIDFMRAAADGVIDSMLSVIETKGGATKQELVDALRREQTNRGLTFEYCLLTAGTSLNRSPSEQRWKEGDILSLDSGGNFQGYIGDLARMAIFGEPDAQLEDLLGEITAIQQAGLNAIAAGVVGVEIFGATNGVLAKSANASVIDFMAHGVGLATHEAPRLSDKAPVPYSGYDGDRPLEAGMIVSVETTMKHPRRGYIKLEDSALVREGGCEVFADRARGWNRGGTAAPAL